MAWTDLVEIVNSQVLAAFKSRDYPTASLSPTAGGGPHIIPAVEREVSTQERTSSGNVTGLFFSAKAFAPTTAVPLPKIGDSITWQSATYKVQAVQMDSEQGFFVAMRKT